MAGPSIPASRLADAVLRISQFRDRRIVVKLGGSAMEDPAATAACLKSVAVLNAINVPLVLVHGGGKPIDRAMAEAGLTPRKVAGRRYTDAATLDIVVRILFAINMEMARQLEQLGAHAAPMSIVHDFPLGGERLTLPQFGGEPLDLGWVGTITRIDVPRLESLLSSHATIPVLPSLALSSDSPNGWLNVNADTAASAVAGALKAEKAIFLTDTPGVLRNRTEPQSLIPRLTEAECRALIASGVIDGGMVPKVEACFEALDAGAKSALILDGRVPYSLLDVFLNDTFTGTEITK